MVVYTCRAITLGAEAGRYRVSEASLGYRMKEPWSQEKKDILKERSRVLVWAAEDTSSDQPFILLENMVRHRWPPEVGGGGRKYWGKTPMCSENSQWLLFICPCDTPAHPAFGPISVLKAIVHPKAWKLGELQCFRKTSRHNMGELIILGLM